MNKALFLDRDGIINSEKNYVHRISDFEFMDGIFDLCRWFQERDYLIIVITNQAGIARGYYTEDDFHQLTEWMLSVFNEQGVKITEVMYCPHHPEFSGICDCRKPEAGMIFEPAKRYEIDLKQSILIGDKISDIEAGKNASIGINILAYEVINICKILNI